MVPILDYIYLFHTIFIEKNLELLYWNFNKNISQKKGTRNLLLPVPAAEMQLTNLARGWFTTFNKHTEYYWRNIELIKRQNTDDSFNSLCG